jgi:exodeoxyribonuclease III
VRIVSWNVTSLARRIAQVPELLERLQADVLCLQEACIRADDAEAIGKLEAAAPGFVCHWSLNRDARNATFRGGRFYGVVTYLREALEPLRVEVPAWDLEGRLVLSHLPGLVIGNVYAVNGTDKPYWDHALGGFAGDRHGFKRRFQREVLARARELAAHGDVVVAGDWNVSQTPLDIHPRLRTEEPHATSRAEFAEQLAASGLVDIYRRLHPEARGYTWFDARAARFGRLDAARVDYFLVSESLAPRVKAAGILAEPAYRPGSDHAPITLEI